MLMMASGRKDRGDREHTPPGFKDDEEADGPYRRISMWGAEVRVDGEAVILGAVSGDGEVVMGVPLSSRSRLPGTLGTLGTLKQENPSGRAISTLSTLSSFSPSSSLFYCPYCPYRPNTSKSKGFERDRGGTVGTLLRGFESLVASTLAFATRQRGKLWTVAQKCPGSVPKRILIFRLRRLQAGA